MSFQPPLSLRLLLLVTLIVCLALAAGTEPTVPPQDFWSTALAVVKVTLYVLLPAVLTAGAIQARGYLKTACIGALPAAL